MKIKIIGAGPAGLYFAALMKRHDPGHDITIYERSRRDATWGFGVVFSDRALEFLRADDEELYQYLTPHMESWPHLTIQVNDSCIPITGNGFAAFGRLELLNLMYAYVEKLGVRIEFQTEIDSLDRVDDADLVVGANGAFSWVRAQNEDRFGTRCDWRPNRFIWWGTSKVFESLSLTFRATGHGVFCAHHYRYSPAMSTFLVEVEEGTWKRAGFDRMSPEDAIRHCETVFAPDLEGHPIISNNSYWRQFPAIWNERWSFGKVVLLGDALRTAHFSIGSGTRLAMEDSVALFKAFKEQGGDVQSALARFQELRMPPMKKIWDAANVSLRWYERMDENLRTMSPIEFAYSYMTRTGRVNHAEVRRRDPGLAQAYEQLHPEVA
ncbi:FAD-dependent monooxygenase [Ramlibacter solisilvae]|uniref:Monooxygenase n=1 Tax=Ramlibacter tataouinensis TaxID=94132 RepID=A0A127JVM1_9BURK|nr:FAD-dependent monooxygenase [Ramlibacter tataouinensis]AMO23974.1 monooxygenase [Ramlibacter tataouinensis]